MASRRHKHAWTAVCLGAALGLAASLAWLHGLGLDPRGLHHRLVGRFERPVPLGAGIFRPHPTRGAQAIPLGTHRHATSEFDVVYSIDETGARRVPGNDYERPIVELLGDSFTFGHGVADRETFGAVLRRRYWPGVAVRDRAILGWSQVPNALVLEEDLDGPLTPSLVLYGWLYAHDERAFRFLHGSPAPFPDWLREIKRRLVDPHPIEAATDPAITRPVGEAVLLRMAEQSAQRGVPFWVIILAMPEWAPHEDAIGPLIDRLDRESIPYVDLQHAPAFARRAGLQFPMDAHPTPAYHRRAAALIAERIPSPASRDVTPTDGGDLPCAPGRANSPGCPGSTGS